jgi:hypothetical protein
MALANPTIEPQDSPNDDRNDNGDDDADNDNGDNDEDDAGYDDSEGRRGRRHPRLQPTGCAVRITTTATTATT